MNGWTRARIERCTAVLFFAALLALGLAVYDDYGICWDDPICRTSSGLLNYQLIKTGNPTRMLQSSERYHGPAFEILLIFIEKGFGLTDSQDIFRARHLATFLLFTLAVFAIYRFTRRMTNDRLLGLLAALMLVLTPRIFADAFYNQKDLPLLSAYAICLASLQRFLTRMNVGNALLHAFCCGFLVDVRIVGVFMPVLTVALAAALWVRARWQATPYCVKPWMLLLFIGACSGFVMLMWPILWHDPLRQFLHAWAHMSHYPWPGSVFYQGENIRATQLPWHYIPVWILITTPPAYLFLFVTGALHALVQAFRRPLAALAARRLELALLASVLVPPAMVIVNHSVVYDGWRHLYFIYPAFVVLAVLGFRALLEAMQRALSYRPAAGLCVAGMAAAVLFTALTMLQLHPHQQVYFNRLAGENLAEIKTRYECDYWGVSSLQGLRYLVAHDSSPEIRVHACTSPCKFNSYMLPSADRARLLFTTTADADYELTHYRGRHQEYPADQDFYAVRADGAKIMLVRSLRETRHTALWLRRP